MLGPGLGLPGSSLAQAASSLGWRGGCLAGVWRSLALEVEGSAGGKGAGRCSRKWGGGGCGGGQEIRFPGSTLLGVSAQDLWLSPSPLELPLTQGPPCVGVCGPEIQPQNQPVRRGGNSGLRTGREGQRTLCPQPVSSLDSYAPLGLPVGREWSWELVPMAAQD